MQRGPHQADKVHLRQSDDLLSPGENDLGEGSFTSDPIPDNFFGVADVAEIRNLQDVLLHVGNNGHRQHVSITTGQVQRLLGEALGH